MPAPNITISIGPEDWQQVAVDYAQQNMELRAHLAAARRTMVEMEQANAGEERKAKEAGGSGPAPKAPG